MKKDYYQTFVDGQLGQNVIKLVNNYTGYRSIVTLDQAIKMKCFEHCPTYFPAAKVSISFIVLLKVAPEAFMYGINYTPLLLTTYY